jgi:hypothetical protein
MLTRVAMVGPVVYEPSVLVRHEHRASYGDLRRQYLSWGKSWGAALHKWYRAPDAPRRALRRVAAASVRHYVHDLVLPTRGRRYRRSHAALMLVGFAVGVSVAYPRSVRRMQERRAAASVDQSV